MQFLWRYIFFLHESIHASIYTIYTQSDEQKFRYLRQFMLLLCKQCFCYCIVPNRIFSAQIRMKQLQICWPSDVVAGHSQCSFITQHTNIHTYTQWHYNHSKLKFHILAEFPLYHFAHCTQCSRESDDLVENKMVFFVWGRALITCISCGTHALPIYIYIVNDCKRKTRQNYRIDYTPNYYYYYIFRSAIFTQYKTNCIVIKLNKVRWKEDIDVQIQMLSILHWLSIVLFNSW